MSGKTRKLIMIMVDGLGIPPESWEKSVFAKFCPSEFVNLFIDNSIPLDAALGVEGLPQSATGQTALFTGRNASQIIGSHLSGFPGPRLKALLKENNIFLELIKRGHSAMFANSYARYPLDLVINTRFASVTSVMLSTFAQKALASEELLSGHAVFHDITRESIAEQFDIPTITPTEGAGHLLNVSLKYDFILFEYFRTDMAGHSGDEEELRIVLKKFSTFLLEIYKNLPPDTGLLLCSDHGNCENIFSKQHTLNKVPLLLVNMEKPDPLPLSITDVYNVILEYFKK
ncbi:MAG TPA: metalloenzyme [Lentisphaeria bacterium]|nr:MAG: hypothetical protein A2X47_02280 [Lentisphaerae bacterium GWF2_38_69]HBM16734.1 metalloenzyme [Lentisphaeria bacterium]